MSIGHQEIAQRARRWHQPLGSRPHHKPMSALWESDNIEHDQPAVGDLLRLTTGRREDAVRLWRQHVRDGRVQFRQAKNEHRNPIDIDIPLHPELAARIEATPSGHMTFLVTEYGKPYTANGFGNAMRDWCDQANPRHCSAHGLRKATLTQMAEAGAPAHELMAVTGHQSLEEVERYPRAANRRKLADAAMAKLKG